MLVKGEMRWETRKGTGILLLHRKKKYARLNIRKIRPENRAKEDTP